MDHAGDVHSALPVGDEAFERGIYLRALTRVQAEFARVTDALIQALFKNAREPGEAVAARIQELEAARDRLHERLEDLERRACADLGTRLRTPR